MLRPRLRISIQAAAAVVAAAYLLRSAVRGWDFRPDLPLDAVFLGLLVALFVLRTVLARSAAPDESHDHSGTQVGDEDGSGDDPRGDSEIGSARQS